MFQMEPEVYRNLLNGLELKNISLKEIKASIDKGAFVSPLLPKINNRAVYSCEGQSISILSTYTISAQAEGQKNPAIYLKATYELLFETDKEFNDDFFNIYKKMSLPLNVWPFVRELMNSITARMNIPPLTLPLLKR